MKYEIDHAPSPGRIVSQPNPADPPVQFERRGHVGIITLNRPAALNAVNREVSRLAGEALEELDRDPTLRVGVITGRGRAFCAGADLRAVAAGEPGGFPVPAWGFAGIVQHVIAKPLIAAVNGLAVGGGLEIVLSCDLAIAAADATFGLPEVRRGLIAGAGGLVRLGQHIPPKLAAELALTGDPIGAARAAELGLVNQVVDPADLLAATLALADRVATNAPLAVQASKRVLHRIIASTRPEEALGWALTVAEFATLRHTEDAAEGPRAFAEKRAPVWKTR